MDVFISIQVVGDGYTQLAQRDIRLTELPGAVDIERIAYETGSLVGSSLFAIASQLRKVAAAEDASEADE